MKKILIALTVVFAIGSSALCGGGANETLATFDGGSVTQKDVEKNNEQEFYEIRQKEFQVRQQAAFESARERIFEIEAKKIDMPVDKFVESEMAKRRGAITEEAVQRFYDTNKNRINQPYALVRDRIRQQLVINQEKGARDALTSELFKKYNFKFNLKEPQAPTLNLVNDGKPFWGKADAKVVVTEFSDFECPYCRQMQGDVQRLKAEYAGKVKWVFRNFPLDFHAQAMPTHIAARCAGKQNKYFEFQTSVFAIPYNGRSLDMSIGQLDRIAQNIGLNMPAYKQCQADRNGEGRSEIEADMRYGQKVGVRGTPTIFINGVLYQQDRSYDALKEAIDKLLNS
ncbi:MAG: thioredoxin domain-containing protein [Spirochaetes bacterium]|nr:thioredoxin domain-containing protein [Spirochaetota bacterium]